MLLLKLFLVYEYPMNSDLKTGGETEDEKVRVDIMENQAMDFRNGFVMLCYTNFVSTVLKGLSHGLCHFASLHQH